MTAAADLVYSTLSNDATVQSLIGGKVFIDLSPLEAEPPSAAFALTSAEPFMTIHSMVPLCTDYLFDLWCQGTLRSEADAIADACAAALQRAGFMIRNRSVVLPDAEQGILATVLSAGITL